MLTVGIEKKLADWPVDLTGAALLSLLLMAVALFAWWLQKRLVGEKEVTSVTGKPGENRGASLGWMTLPAVLVMAAVGGLAVGVPAASMMLTSVMGTLSGGVSVENVTLRHFAALFDQQGDALSALGTSLSLALGSALIVGVLGLLAAWLVMVQKIKGRGMVDALSLMPAALPGVVVGVGLILLWNQPFWPRSPYNTLWMLLLSYCCLLLPWPVRYVGSALRQLGPNLESAAGARGVATAGAAVDCPAAGLSGAAGGDADGVRGGLPGAGDLAAALSSRYANRGGVYLAPVRTGLRRSGHGDGQPDAVDRSGPDADGAGADAAQHARLTTSAQKRRSARKNRL